MIDNVFTSLRLQNFRSYEDFAVELSPTVNIVVGPNASGKTNLLESLLLLCGVGSYRAAIADVIRDTSDWARIDGNNLDGNRVLKIQSIGEKIEKTYELNEKIKKRLSFNDMLPVVLFEPDHLRLLTGSPDLRRDFFDSILREINPEFSMIEKNYKRVLSQRNRLLKQDKTTINKQIFMWNIRLAELAGKIVTYRLLLIKDINKKLSNIYSKIAGSNSKVLIKYDSKIDIKNYESGVLKKLENSLEKDILRGYTSYGPHREDFLFYMNDRMADTVASRGETRTLVLSLKIIELEKLQNIRGRKPLILLDDVFSELDGSRRQTLTHYLNEYQTVITTTDADVVMKGFAQSTNLISL
jgi:DNA replication and repair protein RecF